ncbi:hypothetical protein NPIL_594331 [Nephila pilipes]|uniref:Uncharacterized protein n=1 Tax=Nephila pilipes TaxID=299642 RepID=A0A8X6PG79_NEPPI|nr:hypothetical protein NPIL_594331 [Nephila pilipes]
MFGRETPNNNESISSLRWELCLKTLDCVRKVAEISTNEAIVLFNGGDKSRLKIMQSLSLTAGERMQSFATSMDLKRIQTADRHFNLRTKEVR